jgi:hypothetical protein
MVRRRLLGLLSLTLVAAACGGDEEDGGNSASEAERARAAERGDVRELLTQCTPGSATPSDEEIPLETSYPKQGASFYTCTETRYRGSAAFEQMVTFGNQGGALWPGNVIKFDEFMETGRLTSLPLKRGPVEMAIVGALIEGREVLPGESSPYITRVDEPTDANAVAAMQNLMSTPGLSAPAQITFKTSEYQSEMQLSREFGISAKASFAGVSASVGAFFKRSSDISRNSYLFEYTQAYFSVVASTPTNPADVFATSVGVSELEPFISCESPMAFIKGVTLGRRAYVRIETIASREETERELTAAVKAKALGGSVAVNAEASFSNFASSSSATVEALILGGDAGAGSVSGAEPSEIVSRLSEFFAEGFSAGKPGVIIGYTLQDATGSVIAFADPYDFTVPKCQPYQTTLHMLPSMFKPITGSTSNDFLGGFQALSIDADAQVVSFAKTITFEPGSPTQAYVGDNVPRGLFWARTSSNTANGITEWGLTGDQTIKIPVQVGDGVSLKLGAFIARKVNGGTKRNDPENDTIATIPCQPIPGSYPPECSFGVGEPNAAVGLTRYDAPALPLGCNVATTVGCTFNSTDSKFAASVKLFKNPAM